MPGRELASCRTEVAGEEIRDIIVLVFQLPDSPFTAINMVVDWFYKVATAACKS